MRSNINISLRASSILERSNILNVDLTGAIDPIREKSEEKSVDGEALLASFRSQHSGYFIPRRPNDLFVFDHLNHTGGETLTVCLRDALGDDFLQTPDPKVDPNYLKNFEIQLNKTMEYYLIADHHQMVPERLSSRSIRRFTMLRHPVVRFLSAYFNFVLKRHMPNPVIPLSIKQNKGLEYFLDQISETGNWPGGLKPLCYFDNYNPTMGQKCKIDGSNDADKVRSSVFKRYDLVCINEFYDQSIFLISLLLGLKDCPRWRVRQNSGRPRLMQMRPQVIRKIEYLVEADFELYRQARLLFESKYEKCLSFLEKRGLHLRHYGDSTADGQKLISARLKQFGVSEGDFSSADHGLK